MERKLLELEGDNLQNYLRYDNHGNNAYINITYWERDGAFLRGRLNEVFNLELRHSRPRWGSRDFRFVPLFITKNEVWFPVLLVGDLYWILIIVGSLRFIGVISGV